MNLRVASGQFPVGPELRENVEHVRAQIVEAGAGGARIVVFPETALSGYTPWEFPDLAGFDWAALERATEDVREAAAAANLWVLTGSISPSSDPKRPFNSVLVVSPDGELHGRYDKRLLAASERDHFTPGDSQLTFRVDGFTCGIAICHEWRYPEIYREYGRLGADVVFQCWYDGAYDGDGWEREGRNLSEVIPATARGHAVCNHLWIVGSNTARPHSAFAPFVVRPDGGLHACGTRERTEVLFADLGPRDGVPDGSIHHRARLLEGESLLPEA